MLSLPLRQHHCRQPFSSATRHNRPRFNRTSTHQLKQAFKTSITSPEIGALPLVINSTLPPRSARTYSVLRSTLTEPRWSVRLKNYLSENKRIIHPMRNLSSLSVVIDLGVDSLRQERSCICDKPISHSLQARFQARFWDRRPSPFTPPALICAVIA